MKTLYVSDLDGTLLRSDETVSKYTARTINELTNRGLLFSYATARSFVTAKKVTSGLTANIPLIVYNGAFVIDNRSEEILLSNFFDKSVNDIFEALLRREIFPIVYAYVDGVEKFSFLPDRCTEEMLNFLKSRKGDVRSNPVDAVEELTRGDCFYLTCIDTPEKLAPLYERYRNDFHCVYQEEIYTRAQWLEIMPKTASKSNAVLQLKRRLGCDRLVVFGDGKNDLDLFAVADACYAVENADDELKSRAMAVIEGNDADGVAHWLAENVDCK